MDGQAVKAAAALLALSTAGTAAAHPVDEVVQGAYLMLTPGRLRLQLEITPGPAVADMVLRSLDTDGDHVLSRAEQRAYGRRVLSRCALLLDGRSLAWRFKQIGVPPYNVLRGQAGTIQLFADAPVAIGAGKHRLTFRNAYRPARGPTTANIFAGAATGAFVFADQRRSDDGRYYSVTATAH